MTKACELAMQSDRRFAVGSVRFFGRPISPYMVYFSAHRDVSNPPILLSCAIHALRKIALSAIPVLRVLSTRRITQITPPVIQTVFIPVIDFYRVFIRHPFPDDAMSHVLALVYPNISAWIAGRSKNCGIQSYFFTVPPEAPFFAYKMPQRTLPPRETTRLGIIIKALSQKSLVRKFLGFHSDLLRSATRTYELYTAESQWITADPFNIIRSVPL